MELKPIPQVQGSDATSPYVGSSVSVGGIVTGVQRTGANAGFFLQDPTGDQDPLTSDGLYVRMPENSSAWLQKIAPGVRATVTGTVSERGGMTSIEVARTSAVQTPATPPSVAGPVAQVLDVPLDDGERAAYLEAREGMLVTMADALVVGPTNQYGQYVAVDAAKHGARRVGSRPDIVGTIHVDGKLGPKPQLVVGDRITDIKGPLGVGMGEFQILPTGNYRSLERGAQPPKAFGDIDGDDRFTAADRTAIETRVGSAAAGPLDAADLNGDGRVSRADLNRFDDRAARQSTASLVRIAQFNAWNFFDADDAPPPIDDDVLSANEYQTKLAKLAGAIRDRLGTPDVLALEEVENTKVLGDLLERPELKGLGYTAVTLPTSGRRSINPTLLVRGPGIEVLGARQLQQPARLGEEAAWAPTREARATALTEPGPLFSREPLIVDLRIAGADGGPAEDVSVVVNHFISKYSPHGVPTDPIRIAQGTAVREEVERMRAEHPEREVVVLGDFNDTPDSKTLAALTGPKRAPTLVNTTATMVPEGERYSYVYEGHSELIDHIAVTPGLTDRIERAGVRHGNADAPRGEAWDSTPARASDHDSPYIWLRRRSAPVAAAATGAALLAPHAS